MLSKRSVIWPLEVSMTITREREKDSTVGVNAHSQSSTKKGAMSARELPSVSGSRKHSATNSPMNLNIPPPPPPTDEDTEMSENFKHAKPKVSSRRLLEQSKSSSATVPLTHVETIIIYHGLALVDFTQMLNPGVKIGRYACRLLPYSDKLLRDKTCVTRSAFLTFLQGLSSVSFNSNGWMC